MTRYMQTTMVLIIILSGLIGTAFAGRVVYAQDPTIPTRTPTPDTSQPPPEPSPTSGSDNGGSNPPPAATNTSVPALTATATATLPSGVASTATATPLSTSTATATAAGAAEGVAGSIIRSDPCALPPMIVTFELTLIHTGPGEDYPIVGSLPALEKRLIVGRAEFAPWWQILLIADEPQLLGWVADVNVDEIGDTGTVPLVEPPLLNGLVPTPGALWQPTPLPPACTPTPTPTATPTATPTSTASPTAVPTASESGNGSQDETVSRSAAELSSQESTIGKQVAEGNSADASAAATTAAGSGGSSTSSSLAVPLLGVLLIASGVLIALLSRNKPPAA